MGVALFKEGGEPAARPKWRLLAIEPRHGVGTVSAARGGQLTLCRSENFFQDVFVTLKVPFFTTAGR